MICRKGFVERSQFRRHEQTKHSNEKPFACSMCKFSAKRKDKLKAHVLRLHGIIAEDVNAIVAKA